MNHLTPVAIVAVIFCCSGLLRSDEIDVYLFTGQSNILGTSAFEGTTAEMYGPNIDLDDDNLLLWSNVSASNTRYPAILYGDSDDAVTTFQVQQGDGNANPVFWGPEFGFAQIMQESTDRSIMVIKATRGGGGNTMWDKEAFDARNRTGHMWGHLRDTVE